MDRFPLVISFYTLGTPYEQEVQHLIDSCNRFGIEHEVEGIPSSGSWELNCAFKPLFILKKLEELKRPVLWVDADAVFVQAPSMLEAFSLDAGVRLYDCPDDHPSRVVSATFFANYTEEAMKLVGLWGAECLAMLRKPGRTKEVWDQDALRRVLWSSLHQSKWSALPNAYSIIAGHPEDEKCPSPVIIQNQASRRFKQVVNLASC